MGWSCLQCFCKANCRLSRRSTILSTFEPILLHRSILSILSTRITTSQEATIEQQILFSRITWVPFSLLFHRHLEHQTCLLLELVLNCRLSWTSPILKTLLNSSLLVGSQGWQRSPTPPRRSITAAYMTFPLSLSQSTPSLYFLHFWPTKVFSLRPSLRTSRQSTIYKSQQTGLESPDRASFPRLQYILKGITRTQPSNNRTCSPITTQVMWTLNQA